MKNICETAQERLQEWEGRWVDKVGPSTEANPALPSDFGRRLDIFENFCLSQIEYLSPGQTGFKLRDLAKKVSGLVEDYFFGEWRNSFAKLHKLRYQWFDELRFGLLLSLVANDVNSFQKIIRFPTLDFEYDEGAWDRTKSDNDFYIQMCRTLYLGVADSVSLKGKRSRLLQDVWERIQHRDQRQFEKKFSSYINWYTKYEHVDEGNLLICLDGSIMMGLARMHSIDVTKLWESHRELLLLDHE